MRTGRPQRLGQFDYLGPHRYFLTFCTEGRARLFDHGDVLWLVHAQILRAAVQGEFDVLAYCYMPNHVHLLVEGVADGSDGRDFIKRSRQYSGYAFARAYGRRLWQAYL